MSLGVGVIGYGNISETYFVNSKLVRDLCVIADSDRGSQKPSRASRCPHLLLSPIFFSATTSIRAWFESKPLSDAFADFGESCQTC